MPVDMCLVNFALDQLSNFHFLQSFTDGHAFLDQLKLTRIKTDNLYTSDNIIYVY